MKIKIASAQTIWSEVELPKYFKNDNDYCRVNNDETIFIVRKHYKENDFWLMAKSTMINTNKPIEKISKAEFVAYCNKAYKAITGFRHVEELWKDEEGDAHE